MSGSIVPVNQLPSPSFQQQGSVDWVQLSKSSLSLSIEVLGRLSKAGIEPLTVVVAQAICSPFSITGDSQRKIQLAISKLKVQVSYGNALWFGLGLKSVVRLLMETEQGLLCIALCACLTQSYGEFFAAQTLRDMALSRAAPNDLRPSLSQWTALIKVCAGTLTASDFPNRVEGFSRLWWDSPQGGKIAIMRGTTSSGALSRALYALANVSNGAVKSVTLAGGADCAWLAALAEWLLSLRIEIVSPDGQYLYRNFDFTANDIAQVRIIRDSVSSRAEYMVDQAYIIPSGSPVWNINRKKVKPWLFLHGLSSWSTILEDTFGSSLDNSFSSETAVALFYRMLSDSSSGRKEALSSTLERLPELAKFPLLNSESLETKDLPSLELQTYTTICGCSDCHAPRNLYSVYSQATPTNPYVSTCRILLMRTIAEYARLVAMCDFDPNYQPSSTGLAILYIDIRRLEQNWQNHLSIFQIYTYTSGFITYETVPKTTKVTSAFSRSGLTVYCLGLENPDLPPEMQVAIKVIPGQMERDQWILEEVHDMSDHPGSRIENDYMEFPYFHADAMDMIREYCRSDLPIELLVKEGKPSRIVQASYVWHTPALRDSAVDWEGEPAARIVVALGIAQLRRLLMDNRSERASKSSAQGECIVRANTDVFKGLCCRVDEQIRLSFHSRREENYLPKYGEVVLVREGELPNSNESEAKHLENQIRIQRSRQIRLLYIIFCNQTRPSKAAIVKFQSCLLCISEWKAPKIFVDNDPSLAEPQWLRDGILYAEISVFPDQETVHKQATDSNDKGTTVADSEPHQRHRSA